MCCWTPPVKLSVCRALYASCKLHVVCLFVLNAFCHMIVKRRFSYSPSLGLIILFERLTELRRAQTAIYGQDITTGADKRCTGRGTREGKSCQAFWSWLSIGAAVTGIWKSWTFSLYRSLIDRHTWLSDWQLMIASTSGLLFPGGCEVGLNLICVVRHAFVFLVTVSYPEASCLLNH